MGHFRLEVSDIVDLLRTFSERPITHPHQVGTFLASVVSECRVNVLERAVRV